MAARLKVSVNILQFIAMVSLSVSFVNAAYALGPQTFLGLNYSNPAALSSVHQFNFILGGAELLLNTEFVGTYAGVGGSTSSHTNNFLPYGRIAVRLYPNLVLGLDWTQPTFTGFVYPANSFINTATVSSYGRDSDLSPRISWQATKNLALGLGVNFNDLYNTQINFAIPGSGLLTNKADSWAYGWDAGLLYQVPQYGIVGFSYYSMIVQHAVGVSTLGATTMQNMQFSIVLPETFSLDYGQMMTPAWWLDAAIKYSVWTPFRYITIKNSAAGTITIPLHYYNGFDYSLSTKYDVHTKWSLLGKLEYNPKYQPTAYMSPGLPIYNGFIVGAGVQYAMVKGLSAKFVYGHAFGNPPVNTMASSGLLTGRMHIPANLYDLSVTYDI